MLISSSLFFPTVLSSIFRGYSFPQLICYIQSPFSLCQNVLFFFYSKLITHFINPIYSLNFSVPTISILLHSLLSPNQACTFYSRTTGRSVVVSPPNFLFFRYVILQDWFFLLLMTFIDMEFLVKTQVLLLQSDVNLLSTCLYFETSCIFR